MILRLSQKLNTKIKAGKLTQMPLDDNPYADWSCDLFTADRTQYIILTNTASLYACVLYARGITDDSKFIFRALDTIREFTEDDGKPFIYGRFIAPASESVYFAKALNRTVTGSMNNQIHAAEILLLKDKAPCDIGVCLNEVPMSALNGPDGRKYGCPQDVFSQLINRMGNE